MYPFFVTCMYMYKQMHCRFYYNNIIVCIVNSTEMNVTAEGKMLNFLAVFHKSYKQLHAQVLRSCTNTCVCFQYSSQAIYHFAGTFKSLPSTAGCNTSLVPRCSVGRRESAWYTLFAHAFNSVPRYLGK